MYLLFRTVNKFGAKVLHFAHIHVTHTDVFVNQKYYFVRFLFAYIKKKKYLCAL